MNVRGILRQLPIHQASNHALDDIFPIVCIYIYVW